MEVWSIISGGRGGSGAATIACQLAVKYLQQSDCSSKKKSINDFSMSTIL